MTFYATNEREAQEIIAYFKKMGFTRIENSYHYETWKSALTGDRYELERVF